MTNKKILIQLSDEDSEFFSELLARDDIDIDISRGKNRLTDSDAEYVLLHRKYIASLIRTNNKAIEDISKVSDYYHPSATIKGYTEVLLSGMTGDLTEQQEQILKVIKSNVGEIQAMIYDIRGLASISTGYHPRKQFCNVQESFNSALEAIRETHQTSVPTSLHLKKSLPSVFGDEKYLEESFHLLFLYVLTKPISGVSPVLEVEINDEFFQFSIFPSEMNYDLEIITSGKHWSILEQEQSWLSVAKHRIEWNGGQLWIENEFGVGSTIHFTIPIAQEDNSDGE